MPNNKRMIQENDGYLAFALGYPYNRHWTYYKRYGYVQAHKQSRSTSVQTFSDEVMYIHNLLKDLTQ